MSLGQMIGGAVKAAKNKLNIDYLASQDYEDAAGAATLGSVKAGKVKDDGPYKFAAAKNEAIKFIISQVFQSGMSTRFEDYGNYEGESEFVSQMEIDESQLADMFLKHRKKKGRRGYEASKRDAKICKLILAGSSNENIALELRTTTHNIRRYRTDIRKRLHKIADNQEV